jgi:Tautomerase enzyme
MTEPLRRHKLPDTRALMGRGYQPEFDCEGEPNATDTVKLFEKAFTTEQKQKMIKKLTDTMVSIEGEKICVR